jgi:hypothetical protein
MCGEDSEDANTLNKMASVLLQSDTSKDVGKGETSTNPWWIALIAVASTVVTLFLVYGLEYWITGEKHERLGVFGVISAPVYGLLKAVQFTTAQTSSAIYSGSVGLFENTGKAITGSYEGVTK